ncbi:hypothetical protein VRB23_09300 [Erwinia aphidicola]|uniref:pyocin knob domain-containing protein n=1 Tax=Erwinia aphidicola TaxID=68334 RepID=UPI0030CD99CF
MRDIIDPVDTSDGLFHDGDPSTGVEGTVVHAKWLNAQQGATIDLQTEIKAVLSAAGMTPNSSTLSQLLSALQALFLTSESAAVKNALLKGNNLSDVVNKATALANLSGVPVTRKVNGHTFDKDFDISAADVKALAVTTVRAQVDPPAGNVADANYLPVNSVSFVYENVPNSPPFTGSLLDFSGLGGGYNVQIAARYANQGERIAFRTRNGDAKSWNTWHEIYHTGNKPAPSDVGALPANAPELSVNLNTLGHPTVSIGLYFQGYSAAATAANNYPLLEAGSLLVTRAAYGCQQEYTTYGSGRKFVRGLTGSFNGNGPWGPWKEYLLTTANAASATKLATPRSIGGTNFDGTGNITPALCTAASRLQTARTINGVAFDGTGNISIPSGNIGAYTKAESDARFSPLVPGLNTVAAYVMAISSSGNVGPGSNVAGSSLRASTADGLGRGDALPGTWRCMGNMTTTNDAHRTTLWLRVS